MNRDLLVKELSAFWRQRENKSVVSKASIRLHGEGTISLSEFSQYQNPKNLEQANSKTLYLLVQSFYESGAETINPVKYFSVEERNEFDTIPKKEVTPVYLFTFENTLQLSENQFLSSLSLNQFADMMASNLVYWADSKTIDCPKYGKFGLTILSQSSEKSITSMAQLVYSGYYTNSITLIVVNDQYTYDKSQYQFHALSQVSGFILADPNLIGVLQNRQNDNQKSNSYLPVQIIIESVKSCKKRLELHNNYMQAVAQSANSQATTKSIQSGDIITAAISNPLANPLWANMKRGKRTNPNPQTNEFHYYVWSQVFFQFASKDILSQPAENVSARIIEIMNSIADYNNGVIFSDPMYYHGSMYAIYPRLVCDAFNEEDWKTFVTHFLDKIRFVPAVQEPMVDLDYGKINSIYSKVVALFMYNPEIKAEFLETELSASYPLARKTMELLSPFEEMNEKNIYDFTIDELNSVLTVFDGRPTSFQMANNIKLLLVRYHKWASAKGYAHTPVNAANFLNVESLICSIELQNQYVYSSKELYEKLLELDPIVEYSGRWSLDVLALMLIFDGVKKEIISEIKMSDIKENILYFDGETVQLSPETLDCIEKCHKLKSIRMTRKYDYDCFIYGRQYVVPRHSEQQIVFDSQKLAVRLSRRKKKFANPEQLNWLAVSHIEDSGLFYRIYYNGENASQLTPTGQHNYKRWYSGLPKE